MRKVALGTMLCIICLLPAAARSEKPKGPALERFEAYIEPSHNPLYPGPQALTVQGMTAALSNLDVDIQEFTTTQELRDYANALAGGGQAALKKALSSVNKGYFRIGYGGERIPILIAGSRSAGGIQKVGIIGLVPSFFATPFGTSFSSRHDPYDYIFIHLEVNAQGKGNGVLCLTVRLSFDKESRPVPIAYTPHTHKLVHVRRRK